MLRQEDIGLIGDQALGMIKGSCRVTAYEARIGTNNPGEKRGS